jgi:hypothetical protein
MSMKSSKHQQRAPSVADIKARWHVSDEDYDAICSSFSEILQEFGLLGERIQGRVTQSTLTQAIEKMLRKRRQQNSLKNVDTAIFKSDLRYLAQLLGRNHRRRKNRSKKKQTYQESDESAAPRSPHSWVQANQQVVSVTGQEMDVLYNESKPSRRDAGNTHVEDARPRLGAKLFRHKLSSLKSKIFVLRWQDEGEARLYRPEDFWSSQVDGGTNTLDSLRYEDFMNVLISDLSFTPSRDVLIYDCVDEGRILVSNEKVWKAALSDMFNQGYRHFKFMLQKGEPADVARSQSKSAA